MNTRKVNVQWRIPNCPIDTLQSKISILKKQNTASYIQKEPDKNVPIATQAIKQREYILPDKNCSEIKHMYNGVHIIGGKDSNVTSVSTSTEMKAFMCGVNFGYTKVMEALSRSVEGEFYMTMEDKIDRLDNKIDSFHSESQNLIIDRFDKLDEKIDKLIEKDDLRHDDIFSKLLDINGRLSKVEAEFSVKSKIVHALITAAITLIAAWIGVHFGK